MSRSKLNLWSFLFILTIISSFFTVNVSAIPEYAKDIPSNLKNYCIVCHQQASGGPMNMFGQDYLKHGSSISAISSLDSDGDGFTNDEELREGTFPGDSNSYPGTLTGLKIEVVLIILVGILVLTLCVLNWYLKLRR